jgi:hypothetical protein
VFSSSFRRRLATPHLDPSAAADAAALKPSDLSAAVAPPRALGLVPVSAPQACALKADSAVRCLLSFEGGGVDPSAGDQQL